MYINLSQEELIALLGEDLTMSLLEHATTTEDTAGTVSQAEYDAIKIELADTKKKYISRFFESEETATEDENMVETPEETEDTTTIDDLFSSEE